jgi:hypothetical protein
MWKEVVETCNKLYILIYSIGDKFKQEVNVRSVIVSQELCIIEKYLMSGNIKVRHEIRHVLTHEIYGISELLMIVLSSMIRGVDALCFPTY